MINNIGLIDKDSIHIKYLLSKTTNSNIVDYYKSTNKAKILSCNNAPKNICITEKKNLERMINLLDMDVNTIIHTNSCIYSKFYEIYEEILKDLGYKFQIIHISQIKLSNIYNVYKELKKINPRLNIFRYLYYFLKTKYLMNKISKMRKNIKENIGFELNKGEYTSIYKFFVQEVLNTRSIKKTYLKYMDKFNKIRLSKDVHKKVGVLGSDNYDVSVLLGSMNIETIYSKKEDDLEKCLDYMKKDIDCLIYIRKEKCIKNMFVMNNLKNICEKYGKKIIYIDNVNDFGGVIL